MRERRGEEGKRKGKSEAGVVCTPFTLTKQGSAHAMKNTLVSIHTMNSTPLQTLINHTQPPFTEGKNHDILHSLTSSVGWDSRRTAHIPEGVLWRYEKLGSLVPPH